MMLRPKILDSIPPGVDIGKLVGERRLWDDQHEVNRFIEKVIKKEDGGFVGQGWIHRIIHHHINYAWGNGFNAGILAPFGYGKSVQLAVGKPLQLIGLDTSIRIKAICNSEDTAKGRLGLVQTYIETSEEYHKIFPDVVPDSREKWNSEQLYVKRVAPLIDPTYQAVGVLSTGVGGRSDINIYDDVNDYRNTIQNPSMRKTVPDAVLNTWQSRLTGSGRAVMIATRWHEEDTVGVIKKDVELRQRWLWIEIRVSEDKERLEVELEFPDGEYRGWYEANFGDEMLQGLRQIYKVERPGQFTIPHWVEYPKLVLEKKQYDLGSRAYNRGFRQQAYTEEDVTFPHFERCIRYGSVVGVEELRKFKLVGMGIDLAGKKRKGTVRSVVARDESRIKHLIGIKYMQFAFSEFVKQYVVDCEFYVPHRALIENNSQQALLEDALKTLDITSKTPLEGFTTTGGNKWSLEVGLPSLEVEFERGMWVVHVPHEKLAMCQCDMCKVVDEFKSHPYGESTDGIIAVWLGSEAISERGNTAIIEWYKKITEALEIGKEVRVQ